MSGTGQGFHSTHPSAPPSGYTGPAYSLTLVYPPELSGQSIALTPELTLVHAGKVALGMPAEDM